MRLILKIVALLLTFSVSPAWAIEYGTDASNSPIVVQIKLNFTNSATTCSGALIAPRIVVTADHCIKLVGESNKNNLIQSAKVSPPGALRDAPLSGYVNVSDFIFTPRDGKNGAAFLVLESALDIKTPVRIASASDIEAAQSSKATVKFFGYGVTEKKQAVYKNMPQMAEGELFKDLKNSHVHFRSYPAAPCGGDSGGPIIQQTESEILLFGVVNGPWYVDIASYCSHEMINPEAVAQDKLYRYSVYIPLYTEDAISDAKLAADKVLASPAKSNSASIAPDYPSVMAEYKKLLMRISTLKQRYVNNASLNAMEKKMLNLPISPGGNLSTAIYNIESTNKKIDSSIKTWDQIYKTKIECTKSGKTKKVTGKSPKCPTGYTKSN